MELSTCTWGGIEPLVLPWADNPVSVQGSGATYGIALTLSDPNQFFSVKPALNANNTFVVNQDQCKVSTNYSCIALNGGVYTPPDNVLVNVDPTAWNGTPGGDVVVGDNYQEKLYNDRLRIQDKEIPGFPFYTYERESDGGKLLNSGLCIPRPNHNCCSHPAVKPRNRHQLVFSPSRP